MVEILKPADKKQLSKWIGGGSSKQFELLFKATRDGCAANVFHAKCDNKGPTVTVFYNTVDCIFGGYTSMNWLSVTTYNYDEKAFLFRLQLKGAPEYKKYPVKVFNNASYSNATYGPTFGAGHDIYSFNGTLAKTGNYYASNGGVTLGQTYNMLGDTAATFHAENIQYTDIEVYKVIDGGLCLEKPWRPIPGLNMKTLMSEVEKYSPVDAVSIDYVNILLIGAVGAGKSSYFNTINSIFRGHVTSQACSGSAEHSLTTVYRVYKIRSQETGFPLKFRLCDTRGLEEAQGMDSADLLAILDGHLPDRYQFNPSMPVSPEVTGYKKNPTLQDKIHVIAFVMDGCSVDVFPEKILTNIKATQQKANQRGIPQVVLLTKVDRVCQEVEQDLSQVFYSQAVQDLVDEVSQLVGLPRAHILPVKNYEREMELDQDVNIPALLSVRQMLRFADDYLYNFVDES
ncbi:interferon-induced protein 44-like [Gigantopelta aegis]|uniref:interferon-induced protein 44-like n=1 Tax=Gigantopelta aegis TaxID=1735272 RepID=UPI001B88831C|nr:interferon-induced protein 44-like [Gigantopelta aegis]XP_041353065.1 interferon-induced protein 44-like [Gigantopelta aegis]XP_041353066.1 interferon-induced protein 44-like [Gigantopelta aegis]XP_041353067.1 interferon-induced protein 44-like [Gigantopelta aegis]